MDREISWHAQLERRIERTRNSVNSPILTKHTLKNMLECYLRYEGIMESSMYSEDEYYWVTVWSFLAVRYDILLDKHIKAAGGNAKLCDQYGIEGKIKYARELLLRRLKEMRDGK